MMGAMQEVEEEDIFNLVEDGRWDAVMDLLNRDPERAATRNDEGSTALHQATMNDAPVEAIDALLKAFPGATKVIDDDGWTPLHTASYFDASHEIVQRLVEADLSVVHLNDNENRVPVQLIHEVISARWHGEVKKALKSEFVTELIGILKDENLLRVRRKAKLLIKAMYHGSICDPLPNNVLWRPLHACAGVANCPTSFMQMATKSNLHLLHEPDENGNLPLHIAAANPHSTNDPEEHFKTVAYLVEQNPAAAAARNNQGELPLHLAVQHGKLWEEGVKEIYEAFPAAVCERDKDWQLYPFKVAAIEGKGTMESMNTCYMLLRSFPELERFEKYATCARARQRLTRASDFSGWNTTRNTTTSSETADNQNNRKKRSAASLLIDESQNDRKCGILCSEECGENHEHVPPPVNKRRLSPSNVVNLRGNEAPS
jgi:hypothetical protein